MDGLRSSLVIGAVACLFFLGQTDLPLLEPEEARYAEIPRQMLAEGRVLVPVLHGEPYLHKPPLLYWLVMVCYRLLGVEDGVARLVPAFAGILVVLATLFWGRSQLGARAGWLAAAMLVLTPRFVYQARMLGMDGLLCLWVVASWALCQQAIRPGRFGWWPWLLGGLCAGCGVLTKGPVALVLVVLPLVGWDHSGARQIPWRAWPVLSVAVLVPSLPWFVVLGVREPERLTEFFWVHHVLRYVAPLDHSKPCWYFLPLLGAGMLPWSLLLVPMLRRRAWPREAAFAMWCACCCVGFFSLSGCKRPGYILPAFPALALVLGSYAAALRGRWQRALPVALGTAFVVLLAAGALCLDDYHARFALRAEIQRHAPVVRAENLRVVCLGRRWDSVAFYLGRSDVRLLAPEDDIDMQPTLLFAKPGPALANWQRRMAEKFEVTPLGSAGDRLFVAAVRPREVPIANTARLQYASK